MADSKDNWFFRRSDSDFDRRPGGPGESPQYSKIYDVRSETEFTNRPEVASQLKEYALLNELERQQIEAAQEAQSRVHVFPSVGKFVIPPANTWALHAELIKDKSQNLSFNPERFVYFDKIIADKLHNPAITDPSHPEYARYEGLRNNIAVLRNDVIGIFLNDGSYDPEDVKYIPSIAGIASALGDALANDVWYKRLFTKTLNTDVANVEGIGAREMYNYLLSIQQKPAGVLEGLHQRLNAVFNFPNRSWNLPPLSETPFSPANLAAPLPPPKECFTPAELEQRRGNGPDRMALISEGAVNSACALRSLDTLRPPQREASVEEARTILRWLKNMQFTDRDMEEWLAHGTPEVQVAKAEAVTRLIEIYSGQLQQAAHTRPELMHDLAVEDATDAAGSLALVLATHSLHTLPNGHPAIGHLNNAIAKLPAEAELRHSQSVTQLLATLETGLGYVSRTGVSDQSPADRLADIGSRIVATAKKLRSVKEMEPPAREESIELAREILRKLKNLSFSDKPLDELALHGSPEDKAAFAQKLDEMVDIYKNLLFEAAAITPGILNDPRIKEANDAVGSFGHTITLMASKEIPNSAAAAQRISADVTQMPEEWKGMHERTVARLMHSMEGGLETAVHELMAEQKEQSQDEEITQEAAETHMHHKRRKKRKQRSHTPAARKIHRDITADDYVLKQGRFQEARPAPADRPIMPPVAAGLKAEDLAAIRNLGNSLRDIGNQASALPTAPVDEKIVPDDKTLAVREQEQRNNPRRPRERM